MGRTGCGENWVLFQWARPHSVQFSLSVMSDSLWPYGLQHTRPPSINNSWSLLKLISIESVMPSYLQSFPGSGPFQMSQFFTSGGQSIGVSASASVFPMNIQDWFPLGWTGLISLMSKGLSRVFPNTTVEKHQFFVLSFLYSPTLTSIHVYWKNHSFD